MTVDVLRKQRPSSRTANVPGLLARLLVVFAFDAFAIWFVLQLASRGSFTLAVIFVGLAVLVTAVMMSEALYPLRWMLIGLVMLVLFFIYPIAFTIYVAFTNYGDGHLLVKDQAITQILQNKFVPEGGAAFSWQAFKSADDSYALWLTDADGNSFLGFPDEALLSADEALAQGLIDGVGDNGQPTGVPGYNALNRLLAAADTNLPDIVFGQDDTAVQIRTPSEAATLQPRYEYNESSDTILDLRDGLEFEIVDGTFTASDGTELRPGFRTVIGMENFTRFFNSSALSGPLVRIIAWNFAFAFLSVATTFALGLGIAYIYDDPNFPGKKLLRSFLLIPYTIPSLITILIWKGIMNPELGILNRFLESNFALDAPNWTNDIWWTKVAILIVNLWLGYPYFMLICSGALAAIPKDLYAAAEVDGAGAWAKFWKITLPLLLVSVGPLLVASFTFNFNNFNLIFLFAGGGPPIANSAVAAGHTDILISYVYGLAFEGGRGADYGLASAITIIIFFIVGAITLAQFRWTKMWEEVSESV